MIDTWSAQHPAAAPLVVTLDLKDDLTDNPSFAAGTCRAQPGAHLSLRVAAVRAEDYPASTP